MAVTVLGTLIEDQRARLGLSYRDMERLAGGRLKSRRFHQLATEPIVNVPPTDTLHVLADVLRLPQSVVVDAALESVGLRRSASPSSRWVTIAHAAEEMPLSKRTALEKQVEALLEMYREET
jgi:hypothetical protein